MDSTHNLELYRQSEAEREREADLMSMVGSGDSALDIGARDGHYSVLLTSRYKRVVALDLVKPCIPGVENVAGNVLQLEFDDRSFDLVFCAEVLEHLNDVELAAKEIARVARRRVVIGVPYNQDRRVCRITCWKCGHIDPPWGHVQSFTEKRLLNLFPTLQIQEFRYVGTTKLRTTALAAKLMDAGGNPWAAYDQEESCSQCHAPRRKPLNRSVVQKACGALAHRMNDLQATLQRPQPKFIHAYFVVPA